MFISALDLFKIGIGPSSSHTVGPMLAARTFLEKTITLEIQENSRVRCTLKGSLAYTGKGHATDRAITLGLHDYSPQDLTGLDVDVLVNVLSSKTHLTSLESCRFDPIADIIFDRQETLPQHPNGMVFELLGEGGEILLTETYFSIGGGFIRELNDMDNLVAPLQMESALVCPFSFGSGHNMLKMSHDSGKSIASMKRTNEQEYFSKNDLNEGLDNIWQAMETCVKNGLKTEGALPGSLNLSRRAKKLHDQLLANPEDANVTDWLCAYAMAVSEENASGHMVVTAPTNGAAGVIPSILYYLVVHQGGTQEQVREFLLVASAIGGIIKMRSSISGAEVGCQGEVGSASSMAAAGLCAVRGGTTEQIENAAEIALEHHLGMTCDPVHGLVQVPCVERNGFGAIKAYTATSLAKRGTGQHYMSLDNCLAAMKQTGQEMSHKFKETSLGGLAVSNTEC
ncbi:MAG: L-serine ammonia-lyase [FCB group bacterium]|nr:L-serine ammonia-lyase [FCB group bacterium]MBL7028270.1 L-serine ammonia-lyase [Candidatus Neomarinimicrobiota bacterium]